MARLGRQRRAEQRRARREIAQGVERTEGDYVPPPRDECDPHEWYNTVDDSATLRVSIFTWRRDGRLTDFVFLVEEGDWSNPDAWVEVARIDCCHGRCHLHPPGREFEQRNLMRLDTVDDVERAFGEANELADDVASNIRDRRS